MRVIKKVIELVVLTCLVIPASAFDNKRTLNDEYNKGNAVTISQLKVSAVASDNLENVDDIPKSRLPLPEELHFEIFTHLTPQDRNTAALLSKAMYASISGYRKTMLNSVVNAFNTEKLNSKKIAEILSECTDANAWRKKYFIKQMLTRLENEPSLHVDLSPVLPCLLVTLPFDEILEQSVVATRMYEALFHCSINNQAQRTIALKHLQAVLPNEVASSPIEPILKQDGFRVFIQKIKDSLSQKVNVEGEQPPYFSLFSEKDDIAKLSEKAHNIVITGEQLGDRNFRELIENIFRANSEHILTLSLGKCDYSKKGKLRIYGDTLPKTIEHLVLTDPSGSVTSIGRFFLDKTTISSLTLSGFSHLENISYGFCNKASELRSVEISNLPNLAQIDDFCFAGCTNIESISLLNLPSLTTIGKVMLNGVTKPLTWKISNLPLERLLGDEMIAKLQKVCNIPNRTLNEAPAQTN